MSVTPELDFWLFVYWPGLICIMIVFLLNIRKI